MRAGTLQPAVSNRDSCSMAGCGRTGASAAISLRKRLSGVNRRPSAILPEAVRKYWARFMTTPSFGSWSIWRGPARRAVRIRFADTFEECLKLCTELAQSGDAVLLSPACASWGMFPNYEERGRLFKEYVNRL